MTQISSNIDADHHAFIYPGHAFVYNRTASKLCLRLDEDSINKLILGDSTMLTSFIPFQSILFFRRCENNANKKKPNPNYSLVY